MRSDRILPTEDADGYAQRLKGWRDAVQPDNQILADLVDRAFLSLWKLERGDRREITLALEAMDAAQDGTEPNERPDVDRLHRELLTTPGRCYDQLRQTLTGSVSLRETWAEVKQFVDAGDDLTNIEPEFLLALDGFSTTDLIRGHSRAVALFVATFGTQYGNNPKNVDYLASFLRRHERDKLMAAPGAEAGRQAQCGHARQDAGSSPAQGLHR
jgi:hypothetical protein